MLASISSRGFSTDQIRSLPLLPQKKTHIRQHESYCFYTLLILKGPCYEKVDFFSSLTLTCQLTRQPYKKMTTHLLLDAPAVSMSLCWSELCKFCSISSITGPADYLSDASADFIFHVGEALTHESWKPSSLLASTSSEHPANHKGVRCSMGGATDRAGRKGGGESQSNLFEQINLVQCRKKSKISIFNK